MFCGSDEVGSFVKRLGTLAVVDAIRPATWAMRVATIAASILCAASLSVASDGHEQEHVLMAVSCHELGRWADGI